MKKSSLLITLVFLISLFACKHNAVVENPDYEANGGTSDISYAIDRIELTDSAAIFDMSFYHFPGYWVRISSNTVLKGITTGKIYSLFKTKDMIPDSLEWMQKEAYRTATLYFEPIDPVDKEVDLLESDEWTIKGIKLYDNKRGKIKTNLSGTLKLFGGSWLKVIEVGDDPYYGKTMIVPVRNGKFSYDFYTDEPRLFCIIIGKHFRSGSARLTYFWTEGDSVKLTYPEDDIVNPIITGGRLTCEITDFSERMDSENNRIYGGYPMKEKELKDKRILKTPEMMNLEFILENEAIGRERENIAEEIFRLYETDRAFTPEGKKLMEEHSLFYRNNKDSITDAILRFYQKEFSKPKMTGLAMLYLNIRQADGNINKLIQIFVNNYKEFHPDHPYHKYLTEISRLYEPLK